MTDDLGGIRRMMGWWERTWTAFFARRWEKSARMRERSRRASSGKPEPRCGPWDEQEDGSFVCRKCGGVDVPGSGPAGF